MAQKPSLNLFPVRLNEGPTMQTILVSRLPTGVNSLRPAPTAIVQAGAICYRRARGADGYDVLLISGKSTGRWGIPKGHLETGETTKAAAAREAFEEAGVVGVPTEHSVGGLLTTRIAAL